MADIDLKGAAEYFTAQAAAWSRHSTDHGPKYELAAAILRKLADGTVLCSKVKHTINGVLQEEFLPIDLASLIAKEKT